jgi:hypothetical protein
LGIYSQISFLSREKIKPKILQNILILLTKIDPKRGIRDGDDS